MANVLITSAGSTNGVNIIKALKGHRIIAVDCEELSAGLYMSDVWFVVPKATDPRYKEVMIDICRREQIDIIFPSFSEEIKVLNGIEELNNKLVISPRKVYEITENKILCKAFLRNLNILTPTQYPTHFPMIVKPITGTGSKNTVKVNDQRELDFYLGKDMFYEEFVEGVEYTVDGVSDFDGKMVCALPRIRLEKKGGLATKCVTEKNDELYKVCQKIVEKMKLVGVWNIQCIKKDGKYYFIDINNRFPSGGMPLATASGMNIPEILINILKGITPSVNLTYGKTMLRYYDSIIL
ncbi:ATP-grasp domain-containing protein [Candidatus Dojkabacteria bacterium]|jgi:carbamoyl-phosphate synthase large subunit|nr:ATP-grasp domain-containing protein [Candidatus Dojkabacteria bacterium]